MLSMQGLGLKLILLTGEFSKSIHPEGNLFFCSFIVLLLVSHWGGVESVLMSIFLFPFRGEPDTQCHHFGMLDCIY